jgi:hypothetical protein
MRLMVLPRHGFLVVNGSVHHWHAARLLQRDGTRAHLVASLAAICQV